MIDAAESRLKETNAETREFIEDIVDNLWNDIFGTIDLEFIAAFLGEFSSEDLTDYTCGICMYRTDKCDCSKTGRR